MALALLGLLEVRLLCLFCGNLIGSPVGSPSERSLRSFRQGL